MYSDFIVKIRKFCGKKKLKIKTIGKCGTNNEFPIYAIEYLNKFNARTICFSAGIHGYEVAGPYSILKFIKEFDFSLVSKNINIIIFPVANPTGFNRNKRRNYLRKDLNRHFCDKKLSGENKMLYEYASRKNIYFFHAIHEDVSEKKFYMYIQGRNNHGFYKEIIKTASRYFKINKSKKIYNDNFDNGIGCNVRDGSFEDRLHRDGVLFNVCTETPGKMKLGKRVRLNIAIMKKIIKFVSQ